MKIVCGALCFKILYAKFKKHPSNVDDDNFAGIV